MSHLACAADPSDTRNARQLGLFKVARSLFPDATASLAASAGLFLGPDYHFDLVRPGISLFGGGPQERPDDRIAAVATLEAPTLQPLRAQWRTNASCASTPAPSGVTSASAAPPPRRQRRRRRRGRRRSRSPKLRCRRARCRR